MRRHIYIALLIVCTSCSKVAQVTPIVSECASMPSPRASACVAVLNNNAYIFGGRDSAGTYLNDLWIYDAVADTWSDAGKTPLKARVNAAAAAMGDAIYIGLGFSATHAYTDSGYQRDWWRYTPADGVWTPLADFPNKNVIAPILAVEGTDIYAFYGCGYAQQQEVWRYQTDTDEWTRVTTPADAMPRAFGCAGAQSGGVLYFGTGFNSQNLTDWYMVTLPDNRWTKRTGIPGKGREFCACTATDQYVYLFGGRYFGGDMTGGEVFESYLRYTPSGDEWTYCGTMPCGRAENQIAFTINGKAYFGLGEDAKGKMTDQLYYIE